MPISESLLQPDAPVVMLSFRHRDRLALTLEELGEKVVAARQSGAIVERFEAAGAAIAIIDARDAALEALQGAEMLGPIVAEKRGAMILLLPKIDGDMLPAFEHAGITHFLMAPFRNAELASCLRLARRSFMRGDKRTRASDGKRARAVADVEKAVDQGQIGILYQPQFEAFTNRFVGAEALARWHHPELGTRGGDALMAEAELAGQQQQVSRIIREQVCADLAVWPRELSHIGVSLNIIADDLLDNGFAGKFLELLNRYAIAPSRMTLEITEGSFVRNYEQASDVLIALREAGVKIAVDDFGTGYSSLSHLKSLPVDYLKIDSGLSRDISGEGRERIVVQAVIDLAHSLRLDVIAEGVETEEQLALLTEQGCRYWQGFLKSSAVETSKLLQFL